MEKDLIRKKILEMRRGLTSKYIEDASGKIFEQLIELHEVQKADHILVYSDFDNEVKTAKLTGWLMYLGKNVYLPTVHHHEMSAVNIKSTVLELSKFGVAQPKLTNRAEIIPPEELDVIIVPGLAFDRQLNRVGFGMGYYDFFLKNAVKAKRIALAYDFQLLDSLAVDTHDEAMNILVTPDEIIRR